MLTNQIFDLAIAKIIEALPAKTTLEILLRLVRGGTFTYYGVTWQPTISDEDITAILAAIP